MQFLMSLSINQAGGRSLAPLSLINSLISFSFNFPKRSTIFDSIRLPETRRSDTVSLDLQVDLS